MIRILKISLFTLTILAILVLMGFIFKESRFSVVNNVEVNIFRQSEKGFLSRDMVLDLIDNIDSISNLKVSDINTKIIERKIAQNPYVQKIDSYITLDGDLLVNIEEKSPVIRFYNKVGKSVYVDGQGDFIPESERYTPRVMIISGYIVDEITNTKSNINDTVYSKTQYPEVYKLATEILANPFLSVQISQIYLNSKGEYDLIPELGDHIVKFGTMERCTRKLENLEAYYRKNMVTENWDNYSTINLKYKDQIVCTKK